MGLFSTRHFESYSIYRPSFPRTAFSLSPCSCLSPSRLRGLASQASGNKALFGENETPKSSETERKWKLALLQQLLPSLNVFLGDLVEVNKVLACFLAENIIENKQLEQIFPLPKKLSCVCEDIKFMFSFISHILC